MVLWFHGFMHSIFGQWDADRLPSFMVSMTPCLESEMLTGFVVSWFHALHFWTARCWQGAWFHGFVNSISGQRDADGLPSFMVSWFQWHHLWTVRCWQVSRFHGFVVSWFQALDQSTAEKVINALNMHNIIKKGGRITTNWLTPVLCPYFCTNSPSFSHQ